MRFYGVEIPQTMIKAALNFSQIQNGFIVLGDNSNNYCVNV